MDYNNYTNKKDQKLLENIQKEKRKSRFGSFIRKAAPVAGICLLAGLTGGSGYLLYENNALKHTMSGMEVDARTLKLNVERLETQNAEYESQAARIKKNQIENVGAVEELDIFSDWKEGDETVFHKGVKLPWYLILVNFETPIDSRFKTKTAQIGNHHYVDERAADALLEMLEDGEKEGLRFEVISSYRNIEKQMRLFLSFVKELQGKGYTYEEAFFKAKRTSATPGNSEHHTGLAVDIVSKSYKKLDRKQEETEEFKWLEEHCMEYGFILRYPVAKYNITGIDYEPWHFRYVGKNAAAYIMENNMTLEEYLEMYIEASKNMKK